MPEVTLDLSSPANILLREVLGWLLLSIGLWKLSGKMKWKHRWMAWVPGLRWGAWGESILQPIYFTWLHL